MRTRSSLKRGAVILLVSALAIFILANYVFPADPGHPASDLSSGEFGPGNFTISGNLIIGSDALFFADNSTGRIGIGTANPQSLLHISGTGHILNASIGSHAMIYANGTTGMVGINNSIPQYTLDVNGNMRMMTGELYLTGIANTTSTEEGTIYYDTDDDQLKVYANGKWQSDRAVASRVVAANDSVNWEKADYVADGINGTDDAATIKAAINSLPKSGGIVYLLDGTFYLDSSLQINRSNFTLTGTGRGTVLKRMWNETTANTGGVITLGNGSAAVYNIMIAQLSIDGNNKTYSNANNHGIFFNHSVHRSIVRNTWIHDNGGNGIFLRATGGNTALFNRFEYNYITSNSGAGILQQTNADQSVIVGNTIIGNKGISGSDAGIYLDWGAQNVIMGNYFSNNIGGGVFTFNGGQQAIIANTFDQNGLIVQYDTAAAILGNSFYKGGLSFKLNSDVAVIGNVFAESTGDSILISGGENNMMAASNSFFDNGGASYAIDLDWAVATSMDFYLGANLYTGTGAASINDPAMDTIYSAQTFGDKNNTDLILRSKGKVGIGTKVPAAKLHINVTNSSGGGTGSMLDALLITNASGQTYLFVKGTTGFVGIGTTKPTHTFNVKGTLNVTGDTTGGAGILIDESGKTGINNSAPATTLQVNGSMAVCSFADTACPAAETAGDSYSTSRSGGAIDIAEWIKFSGIKPEPGDVLCIAKGKSKGGTVRVCNESNTRLAAGIASTKPHMIIGEEYKGEDAVQIAIAGRVPVNVIGDVKPGDLLVSAGEGKAMACKEECEGLVIAKSVTKARNGKALAMITIQ
ncbi:right-handed parallel beta-helix repeat-containing protein [Candidatus Woesearchaeota archaeon]|nr:right-handed parallel beta-helix repeat-containing protein [Candidatus Woesearchaeota archaeon]